MKADGAVVLDFDGPTVSSEPHPVLGQSILFLYFGSLSFVRGLHCFLGQWGDEEKSWEVCDLPKCNALAALFRVEVRQKGQRHAVTFSRGQATGPTEHLGPTSVTGTSITFLPDPDIFSPCRFEANVVRDRLQELACLNSGLQITFENEESGTTQRFQIEDGIASGMALMSTEDGFLYPDIVRLSGDTRDLRYQLGFRHSMADIDPAVHSFANSARTRDGGTHVNGFVRALARSLTEFASTLGWPAYARLRQKRFLRGLQLWIAVWMDSPHYISQMRTRLINPEVEAMLLETLTPLLHQFWKEHAETASAILMKAKRSSSRTRKRS